MDNLEETDRFLGMNQEEIEIINKTKQTNKQNQKGREIKESIPFTIATNN